MNTQLQNSQTKISANPVVNYALQLLALALLLVWCFRILEPFITPIIWASVLATTLYPMHRWLSVKIGNRNGLSATVITVLMLAVIIGPAVWLLLGTVDELRELGASYKSGQLNIPPPADKVKDWPIIGTKVYAYWTEASSSLSSFLTHHQEEAKGIFLSFFDLLKSTGKGIVLFALSIIISGFLLGYAEAAGKFSRTLLKRIAGQVGESMIDSASVTVQNVAKGVLGVAVIQSILAGIRLVVAGIPFAGLWIILCLILAIIQVGILPISVGTIIYIWSHADNTTAIIFTVWMVLVGVVDNILKPFMLGKGAPAPMLVVFLGAIGGFIFSGFIGLFTGAIVLTLGYKLITGWIEEKADAEEVSVKPKAEG